jgi:hypothetical protein
VDINLTNIPAKSQGTLPVPLRFPSLRQSLESYLPQVILDLSRGSVFRLRQSGEIIYRYRPTADLWTESWSENWPEQWFEQAQSLILDKKALENIILNNLESSIPYLLFEVQWQSPSPWLDFILSQEQLSIWVAYLGRSAVFEVKPNAITAEPAQDDFPLQYAHARCWAAICWAAACQEAGNSGKEAEFKGESIKNKPINSLIAAIPHRALFGANLQLDSPTQLLINRVVEFVDHQHCPKRSVIVLISRQLAHAILEYLRHGAMRESKTSAELGQGHLALIMLGQQLLRWVLEVRCGVVARCEL